MNIELNTNLIIRKPVSKCAYLYENLYKFSVHQRVI